MHWLIQAAIDHGARDAPDPGNFATPNPDATPLPVDDPQATQWCRRALDNIRDEIKALHEGERADQVYRKAFRVGTLVAGGYLDYLAAWDALYDAAETTGLPTPEIVHALHNGFDGSQTVPATLQLTPTPPASDFHAQAGEWADTDDDTHESWIRQDPSAVLDGTWTPPETGVLVRDDTIGLLYPGHVHWFHGESESGKSWVAQAAAARVLQQHGRVLFIDHESNLGEVVNRLLLMGVDPTHIRQRFDYVQPDTSAMREPDNYAKLLAERYELAVVDGVTDAVGLDGISSTDNDEVAGWMRRIPKQLAKHTGAAVVCIDHQSKDTDNRGRFAIGGQHKLSGLDGAAYVVEPVEPIGKGLKGTLTLRIAKDRPGEIRPHCGKWRKTDRTQEAARVTIDSSSPGRTIVTIAEPEQHDPTQKFRPTHVMEKISRYVEDHPYAPTRRVRSEIPGDNNVVDTAIERLEEEGHLKRYRQGSGVLHDIVNPFRAPHT